MANICTFEMRIKGSRNDCFYFFNADSPSYDRGICGEYGSEDCFTLCSFGECRYDLHSMDKGESSLAELTARFNVEMEVFGYDISEPEWIQHFHYKNGECLHAFDLPTVVQDLEEFEIPEEHHGKYSFNEDHEIYVLRSEYFEDFEWDEDEEIMRLPWRMSIPVEE